MLLQYSFTTFRLLAYSLILAIIGCLLTIETVFSQEPTGFEVYLPLIVTSGNISLPEPISGLNVSNDGPTMLGETTNLTTSVTGGTEIVNNWDFGDGMLVTGRGASLTHTYTTAGTFTATVTASNSVSSDVATTMVVIEDVPPIASFSSSSPDQVGEVTTFTNSSTGTSLIYDWDFGDGNSSTAENPSHPYDTQGSYTVTLTASNSVGIDTMSATVVIEKPPDPISGLTLSNDGPTFFDDSTTLDTSITAGSDVSYDWDFGDGNSAANAGPVVNHTYGAVGAYIATVTASNAVSSDVATTMVVIEDVPPIASFSHSSPDRIGEVTSFINTSTGTNLTYKWNFGDGSAISTLSNVIHTYGSTGTFTVVLKVSNSAGSNTISKMVLIEDAGANPNNDETPLEASGLTPLWAENFTDGSIDKMQYTWAKGDHAALRSFVMPGAMYFGQEGALGWPWVEQEINNFKEYDGELLPNTLA